MSWLYVLLAIFYYAGAILRWDLYASDMSIHTPWTFRLNDHALFPDDIIVDYSQQFSPLGVRALAVLAAAIMDTAAFAEVIALPLCAISLFLLYQIGKVIGGNRRVGGWIAVVLVSLRLLDPPGSLWFPQFQGSLARSYAFPILLWAVYGLVAGRTWMLGAACLLGALFYPPTALILGLLCALVFALDRTPLVARLRHWAPTLSLSALAGLYLLSLSSSLSGGTFGALFSLAQARTMPEYGPSGPLCAILPQSEVWATVVHMRFGLYFQLVLGSALYALLLHRKRLPSQPLVHAALLTAVGLVLFLAAYALLFRLYEPARYLYQSYMTASVLLAVPVCVYLTDWVGQRIVRDRIWSSRWLLVTMSALALVASASICFVSYRRYVAGLGTSRAAAPAEIYAALRALPADTLVAGHPVDVSDVALFAKRSVLVTSASLFPYHTNFHHEMRRRFGAYARAAYATSWSEVRAFAEAFNVAMLLVNSDRYQQRPPSWIALYDDELNVQLSAGRTAGFVLLNPPAERVVARSGAFTLVDVRGWGDASSR